MGGICIPVAPVMVHPARSRPILRSIFLILHSFYFVNNPSVGYTDVYLFIIKAK